MKSIDDAEREASNILMPILDDHIQTTEATSQLIATALDQAHTRSPSTSQRVTMVLLLRLAIDLRAASVLVKLGYAVQSATLVSSIYELAFTIAYIGSNDELASQWVEHADESRPFRNARELTRGGAYESS